MYKYDIEKIHAIKQEIREHIDSCYKGSKSCAEYLEHSTAHFNNVANITIDSDSITPKNKKNWREENSQKDHEILFNENEGHIRV